MRFVQYMPKKHGDARGWLAGGQNMFDIEVRYFDISKLSVHTGNVS